MWWREVELVVTMIRSKNRADRLAGRPRRASDLLGDWSRAERRLMAVIKPRGKVKGVRVMRTV